MDDYHFLAKPDCDSHKVLKILHEQAARSKFNLNADKTRYVPLVKPFRYCKTKYIVTESGHIVRRANKTAVPRDRRKIKALYRKVNAGEMSAYLQGYDEHKNILKLRRLFYSIFGFSCESIENFRKRDRVGICNNQAI